MNRLYYALFCLILTACAGSPVTKPSRVVNAESYSQDAIQAYKNEDWSRAQGLFKQALSFYQSMDDRPAILTSHINLVEVALALGDTQEAYQHLKLADNIVSRDGLKSYRSRITLLNVLLLLQDNQTMEAESLLLSLLPVFTAEKLTNIPGDIQIVALATQLEIAFLQKNNELIWLLRYQNALESLDNNNTGLAARLLRFQSKWLLQKGHYAEAEAKLQQALTLYKIDLTRTGIAGTLLELGELYQKQADYLHAIDYFKRAIVVFRSLGNVEKVKKVTVILSNAINKLPK